VGCKILILQDLIAKYCEIKTYAELGCGLDPAAYPAVFNSSFFRATTLKILISKNLDGTDLGFASQNLERLRLTRKILRNKDLARRPGDGCHASWLRR